MILADESNIGKIYANTNIEEKYLTVLSGGRKVVDNKRDENNVRANRTEPKDKTNGEITVEEVKKLNERLYSENFLYRDIKEKVIGKTLQYYPELEETVVELICGNEKNKGLIYEDQYKQYLLNHINQIVNAFDEITNRNLRIVKSWLYKFRKIYDVTAQNYSNNKYLEDILNDFLHYSIWVVCALMNNKKINYSVNHGRQEMVYFEDDEYNYIYRFSFVDKWFKQDVWNDKDWSWGCKSIIRRKEQENVDNPPKIHSTGVALEELRGWYYLEDDQVKNRLECLVKEVEEGKYAYYDYSRILLTLLFLQEKGLFVGDIKHIQTVMIDLITGSKVSGQCEQKSQRCQVCVNLSHPIRNR